MTASLDSSQVQTAMDPKMRRQHGVLYTCEKNIFKVIRPQFLDDLRAELVSTKGDEHALRGFHEKLCSLSFFDPACGCGDFLVIAYRELRLLEEQVLRAIGPDYDADWRVGVDQFYGIELDPVAAQTARDALLHMDREIQGSGRCTQRPYRTPLETVAPHIVHGNALELDWVRILFDNDALI